MFKKLFSLSAGPPRLPGIHRKQNIYLAAIQTTVHTTKLKENENGH